MSQGQNQQVIKQGALALIIGAIPGLIQGAQGTGLPGAEKHNFVRGLMLSALQIGGYIVSAQNPLYAGLIDVTIKALVAGYNAQGGVPMPVPIVDQPPANTGPLPPMPGRMFSQPAPMPVADKASILAAGWTDTDLIYTLNMPASDNVPVRSWYVASAGQLALPGSTLLGAVGKQDR